jgi:hypothetical protein
MLIREHRRADHADGRRGRRRRSKALARLIDFHVEPARRHRRRRHHRRVGDPRRGEHCDVIGRCVELAAGRIPIIAGTGANATAEAIRLTRCAERAGATRRCW